jgi:hypothetical protein
MTEEVIGWLADAGSSDDCLHLGDALQRHSPTFCNLLTFSPSLIPYVTILVFKRSSIASGSNNRPFAPALKNRRQTPQSSKKLTTETS